MVRSKGTAKNTGAPHKMQPLLYNPKTCSVRVNHHMDGYVTKS